MKKYAVSAFILLFSTPIFAGNSPLYMALKLGFVKHEAGISDAAINTAFDIGYTHNRHLSTEVEISQTIVEGDNNGNDWSADSLSVFAALRTSGSVKLKAKIGLTELDNDNGFTLSSGLGISYWSLGGLTEIEFTRLDDNVSFISFGVNYFY